MIDVHVYGKLRRFSSSVDPKSQSVVSVEWQDGNTVGQIIDRLGIPLAEVGSNVFLNGRYADLDSPVQDGDRLGLFPDDMQLLYKWYFAPTKGASAAPSDTNSGGSRAPNQDSAAPKPSNEGEK
jgi:molybdopterin converting factor small subunit